MRRFFSTTYVLITIMSADEYVDFSATRVILRSDFSTKIRFDSFTRWHIFKRTTATDEGSLLASSVRHSVVLCINTGSGGFLRAGLASGPVPAPFLQDLPGRQTNR